MNFGTITNLSPLSILVDGASTAQPVNHDAAGGIHNIGDRVLWDIIAGQMCIYSAPPKHYEEWDISPANNYTIANGVLAVIHTFLTLEDTEGSFGAQFVTSTGRWGPPVTGVYSLKYTVGFATWAAGRFLMRLRVNGKIVAAIDANPTASGQITESCGTEMKLVPTDSIDFLVFQGSGATRTIENDANLRSFLTTRRVL